MFPFQDDFSVGTIHGANAKPSTPNTAMAATAIEVVEIQDNNDNVNVLPSKTMSKPQSEVAVGSWVASSSNPVSGPAPTLPSPRPPAEDQKILPAPVRLVEPPGGADGK